ncbi:MAG: metallophosphoesterase [Bacteroidales bacterium]|nr:metallophosphoesterase [Bacteroidales bacterium]
MKSIFVSDLHGKIDRYEKFFALIGEEKPELVFMGGDILPHMMKKSDKYDDFIHDYLMPNFVELKEQLQNDYPEIFLILGNDDPRVEEQKLIPGQRAGYFTYVNETTVSLDPFSIYGYAYIPPTPFQLKDWEKYDVSRYVDPGCTHPDEGYRSVEMPKDIIWETIAKDLSLLTAGQDLSKAVFLFHSPPYNTSLDRAALDGMMVDHVPLDVHVGSIAIQRFILEKQPYLTLHGHVHESARLSGKWMETNGRCVSINAAHDGPELAAVVFDMNCPGNAIKRLI